MSSDISIAVIGSINLDLVATIRDFPQPGETVTNAVLKRFPGGKGANQALAAKRLGASVYMVGRVGSDPVAEEALLTLREAGVDLSYCKPLDGYSTGLAMIMVNAAGENQIVVAPGANAAFDAAHLEFPRTDATIAQLEVPVETILKAARTCDNFFCLNAAPAKPVPHELLEHVDLLVVNEIEARVLGEELNSYRGLLASTFGANGAILSRNNEQIANAKPPRVDVVDTTGAGDAFTAALTVALVSGMQPQQALERACIVGALATTELGAQSSPTLQEVQRLE
ncbi:MAG: ribokinase [Xanthomonadales bacterium]|nr:ribokinase [Gammaproteobacteria bacterium]MBT8075209.1 ribokinase [Gammaproteobacteria bacterium]NNK05277.1 ribokinase [Xanthomonadales bacterium]NNK99504.1 ribokinase [Xanthomonadales bacterium]